MRVDRQLEVGRQCGHLDGKHALGDELAGSRSDNAHAEDAFGLRIDQQLGQAVRAIDRHGTSERGPGELGDLDLAALLGGFGFGQSAPGHFGIGEHNGRDGLRLKGHLVPGNGFDGHARLVRGLVGQHRLTDDVAGEPMLAHKATYDAKIAVEAIAGHKVAYEPRAIPAVVFTDPELAWCGLTEIEAERDRVPYEVQKFPWGASGRATSIGRTDGLTKILFDPKTERVLGVGIVGAGAGEMIAEGVLAIEMAAVATDLAMTIHSHPTLSETMMESAEAFFGHATHVFRPKKKG